MILLNQNIRCACVIFLSVISAQANPVKLFRTGNEALAENQFNDAVAAYTEATIRSPDSAEIFYNLGHAHFNLTDFEAAGAAYNHAAVLAKPDRLRSQSWYNLGNCFVEMAGGIRETDAPAAIYFCQQAIWFYRTALDIDLDFADAAYNLEITQRMAAIIEEEIQDQEEKEQQENQLIKYIREKLTEFIERQDRLIKQNATGHLQQLLEQDTRALSDVIEDSGLHEDLNLPDGERIPGPLKETFEHTVSAANAMGIPDQKTALAELRIALEMAPDEPGNQEGEPNEDSEDSDNSDMEYTESDENADMYEEADPFGDFSEYEEIRGVPPPNQTEMDILAEEVRNQERRKQKKAGTYKSVEKDW